MISPILFRDATVQDISTVAALHTISWKLNYRGSFSESYLNHEVEQDRLSVWTSRLENSNSKQKVTLAIQDDTLIGFVCTFLDYHQKWGAYLDNIHVIPEMYGHGIGASLMKKSAQFVLKERPCSSLYLWVLEKNLGGIKFYNRIGGCTKELELFDNPGGGQSAVYRIEWKDPKIMLEF